MNPITVTGRLFGPGYPSTGLVVDIHFAGQHLVVGQDGKVDVRILELQSGGFDTSALTIIWSENEGQFAVVVDDELSINQFIHSAPSEIADNFDSYRSNTRNRRLIWRTVSALAASFVFGLFLLWWQYDEAVNWVAHQIPPDVEVAIGRKALEEVQKQHVMLSDTAYHFVVTEIGEDLTAGSEYTYEWYVADTDQVNAFAMPGGVVVVYRGLIDAAKTPEELAGVLAHEVQHIEQKHVLRGLIHSLGWAALLTLVSGDTSVMASLLIFEAGASYFSRELESEADRGGVQALYRAGIDPNGMSRFFETMMKSTGDAQLTFLSSHPSTSQRIKDIEQLIQALPPKRYRSYLVDWSSISSLNENNMD